jgi:hypothetical protein
MEMHTLVDVGVNLIQTSLLLAPFQSQVIPPIVPKVVPPTTGLPGIWVLPVLPDVEAQIGPPVHTIGAEQLSPFAV